jgi:chromosomal replication initiator protein
MREVFLGHSSTALVFISVVITSTYNAFSVLYPVSCNPYNDTGFPVVQTGMTGPLLSERASSIYSFFKARGEVYPPGSLPGGRVSVRTMSRWPASFATFVATDENRSALLATQEVARAIGSGRPRRRNNPLFLHGPTGIGKSHLIHALIHEAALQRPELAVTLLAAADLEREVSGLTSQHSAAHTNGADSSELGTSGLPWPCDLLVVEDLQHLPLHAAERLVVIVDSLLGQKCQVVLTGNAGPQDLSHRGCSFPARLTSRLAAGLVVGLCPLQQPGRLALLKSEAKRRRLAIPPNVLDWLSEYFPGSARQLLGAISRLETVIKIHGKPPDLAATVTLFQEQARLDKTSVVRIAQSVGEYFQIEPTLLQSRKRSRGVLWPRQVSMYLARKLTSLSLEQIGAYFGGRDHSTVLHACRKVEAVLTTDVALSGAVHQLHAELA